MLVENIAADVATERGLAAATQIGSTSPFASASNNIGGDLTVSGTEAQVFANNLQADNNTGPLNVVTNTVGGSSGAFSS